MSKSIKMDLHGVRTASDVERKYAFGKSFAEIRGTATDAQVRAARAAELDQNLTQEEIVNRLTNNGEAKGIFLGDDGQLYIKADYIVELMKVFANDIVMTGKFTNTVNAYVVPSWQELGKMYDHVQGENEIPNDELRLYDFNDDGFVDDKDIALAKAMQAGTTDMRMWIRAKTVPIKMTIDMANPEKVIHFTGTNMWGGNVDGYLGVNFTSATSTATETRFHDVETRLKALEDAVLT